MWFTVRDRCRCVFALYENNHATAVFGEGRYRDCTATVTTLFVVMGGSGLVIPSELTMCKSLLRAVIRVAGADIAGVARTFTWVRP